MNKETEKEETEETEKEETQKEETQKPVVLGQVPTEYELVYKTPEGSLRKEEYLVWIGNMLIEIKEALVG